MKIGQLAFILTSLIFSSFVSASGPSPNFPLNFLFTTSYPHIQVRNISCGTEDWCRNYFTAVKNSGYDLNTSFKDGDTLLHIAIQEDCPNMVKILLELGADVSKKNNQNESPLEYIKDLIKYDKRYENVWHVFEAAGYKADEIESEESSEKQTGDDEENQRPSKMAKVSSFDESEYLKAPLTNAPCFEKSEGMGQNFDLSFDLKEVIQIFSKAPVETLPIPPLFVPAFPIQFHIDAQCYENLKNNQLSGGCGPMSSGTIAVIGSTGRTGILCVQAILDAGYSCNAICRSQEKAYDVFTVVPKSQRAFLNVKEVKNIENVEEIKEAIKGCTSVIFVACGVSFLGLFNRTGGPKHVDFGGVVTAVEAIKQLKTESDDVVPKFVLISSLGVTRPYWPIYIMLNTLGGRVMSYKLKGEDCLRAAGSEIDYTIIRPGRLVPSEKNPQLRNSELVVDQGDKITGQILREDVARIALYAAINRASGNKTTFELISSKSGTEIKEEHLKNVDNAASRSKDPETLLFNLKTDLQLIK